MEKECDNRRPNTTCIVFVNIVQEASICYDKHICVEELEFRQSGNGLSNNVDCKVKIVCYMSTQLSVYVRTL